MLSPKKTPEQNFISKNCEISNLESLESQSVMFHNWHFIQLFFNQGETFLPWAEELQAVLDILEL